MRSGQSERARAASVPFECCSLLLTFVVGRTKRTIRQMATVFISYSRNDESLASDLAADMESLGHVPWFDQELSGGQAWWDRILAAIRGHDIFVLLVTPESLDSTACTRERGYAADLGKPILPVLASDRVNEGLLPEVLTKIQYVDYRNADRDALRSLAKSLNAAPRGRPPPDPLPRPPEAPMSYLTGIVDMVGTETTLGFEDQTLLVTRLRVALRDPAASEDARRLLEKFRRRRDLLASVAVDIDDILRAPETEPQAEAASPGSRARVDPPPEATRQKSAPTLRDRIFSAVRGAALGAAVVAFFGWLVGTATQRPSQVGGIVMLTAFAGGLGAAVAGVIVGRWRRQSVIVTLATAAAGWVLVFIVSALENNAGDSAAFGVLFGMPLGTACGGVLDLVLRRRSAKR